MKSFYPLLFVFLIAFGCSKSSGTDIGASAVSTTEPSVVTVGITPKTNTTQEVWQLCDLSVGGVTYKLTEKQLAFYMILYSDNKYVDLDGVAGTWKYPCKDTLVIMQTNLPTAITLKYKIYGKTSKKLYLTKGSGDSKIDLSYDAR